MEHQKQVDISEDSSSPLEVSKCRIIAPIKPRYNKELPFSNKMPSFLATLTLLQYLKREEVFDILQYLSKNSRAYHDKQEAMLKRRLHQTSFTPKLQTKRASNTVLSMFGRTEEALQVVQVLSKRSRQVCRQENGF